MLGDVLGRPGGVVGDEAESHARVPGSGQRLGDAGHRVRSHVDDAVEVEQGDVVDLAGRHGGAGREGLDRRVMPTRAASGPHSAQRPGVVPQVGAHGDGQGQVLGGQAQLARLARGQAEAEVGVVVGRVPAISVVKLSIAASYRPASYWARASASRMLRDLGSASTARARRVAAASGWPFASSWRPRRYHS